MQSHKAEAVRIYTRDHKNSSTVAEGDAVMMMSSSVESITIEAIEHHRNGEYELALKAHGRALTLLEETTLGGKRHHFDTADRYQRMGSVMEDAGNFEQAKGYYEKAISILGEIDVDTQHAKRCKGKICGVLGHMMYKHGDYEGAIKKFSEAKHSLEGTRPGDKSKLEEIEYLMELAGIMMGD